MNFAHVWRFADAPEWYKNLSHNGGDEDWVIAVTADDYELGDDLACALMVCDYDEYTYTTEYGDNVIVFITNHA